VSALNTMHAALRPDGLLLDVHPEPEHATIEIHLGDRVERLGAIDQTVQIQSVVEGRAALQAAIDAGQWARERAVSFTFIYHCDSVDAWLKHLADRGSDAVIPEDLIARARELLTPGKGELRMLRPMHAARLRRV
jgi:hypothetical protein